MRREFDLPEEDVDFLTSEGFDWENIIENNHKWLLIHNYPINKGYNVSETTVALRIDNGYPNSQIDMAYFYPALHRVDGKPIGALANQTIEGKTFQRWSRHRTKANPWRAGLDNIETHLMLVRNWIEQEFSKR